MKTRPPRRDPGGTLDGTGERRSIMAKILVLYGTTDGHTAKVVATVAETLRRSGAAVDVILAGTTDPAPEDYAGVIVAASVHIGSYQRKVRQWVRRHADALRDKPSAFLSVSLGVLQDDPKVQRDIEAIVSKFLRETHWQPALVQNVAGAVLYTKYNALKRWMMKRIVAKAGGGTDTSRDYEYTNWAELGAFAERFSDLVAA
jgi:menaquinone-dependent protoporphyrinogen oxidase